MYAWPILLPAQSNREDFLKTLSLFDDDTGDALDVSGRTLALPGDFAGANWTVTAGAINTVSVTPLTIKDYPFGNEMQAMASVVGAGLGILPGDPITFADVNPLNSMTGYVTSYVAATGALVMQIGCSFDLELRSHHHHGAGYGETEWSGEGVGGPVIRAQLGSGITVVGLGVLQLRIPAFEIAKLRHKTYGVGMTMYDGSDTRQLFIGKQPILSGGVSTMPFPPPQTSNPYGLP